MIGGGAQGRVYEVEHNETKQRYAMKEIPKMIERGGKQTTINWINEAKAMEKVQCRFVVKIVDLFDDDLHGYIVMELCEGDTLGNEIATRR